MDVIQFLDAAVAALQQGRVVAGIAVGEAVLLEIEDGQKQRGEQASEKTPTG